MPAGSVAHAVAVFTPRVAQRRHETLLEVHRAASVGPGRVLLLRMRLLPAVRQAAAHRARRLQIGLRYIRGR